MMPPRLRLRDTQAQGLEAGRADVDLLILNSARNDLQHAVTSEGGLILDRDPLKTSNFIEKVLSAHKNCGTFMRTFLSDPKSGPKEDYLDQTGLLAAYGIRCRRLMNHPRQAILRTAVTT